MKKWISLFVACCLILASVSATAQFFLPDGAEEYLAGTAVTPVPGGLEPMYALMDLSTRTSGDLVEVIRMKNGRVLVSVATALAKEEYTAEELLASAPDIAKSLEKEAAWTDGNAANAQIEKTFGMDTLHMTTVLAASSGDAQLMVSAEGWLFSVGRVLVEMWMISPSQPVYVYDSVAASELESDLADARAMLGVLTMTDFGLESDESETNQISGSPAIEMKPSTADLTAELPETVLYTDPDGLYSMMIPVGSIVLNRESTQEDFEAARAAYTAAHPDGADTAFNYISQDVEAGEGSLIITPDCMASIEIYALQVPSMAGVTIEILAALSSTTEEFLKEYFGEGETLVSFEKETVSGEEFSREVFRASCRDYAMLLYTDGIILPEGIDWEFTILAPEGATQGDMLYRLAVETLHFTK